MPVVTYESHSPVSSPTDSRPSSSSPQVAISTGGTDTPITSPISSVGVPDFPPLQMPMPYMLPPPLPTERSFYHPRGSPIHSPPLASADDSSSTLSVSDSSLELLRSPLHLPHSPRASSSELPPPPPGRSLSDLDVPRSPSPTPSDWSSSSSDLPLRFSRSLFSPLLPARATNTPSPSENGSEAGDTGAPTSSSPPMASSPPRRGARRRARPPPIRIPSPNSLGGTDQAVQSLDSMYAPDSAPTCVEEAINYLDDDVRENELSTGNRFLNVLYGVHREMGVVMDEAYTAQAALTDAFGEIDAAVDSTRTMQEQYETLRFQRQVAGAHFHLAANVLRRLQIEEEDALRFLRPPDTGIEVDFFRVVRRLQEQRDDALMFSGFRRSLHVPPVEDLLSTYPMDSTDALTVTELFLKLARYRLILWLHQQVTAIPLRADYVPNLVLVGIRCLFSEPQAVRDTLHLFALSRMEPWGIKFERENRVVRNEDGEVQPPSADVMADPDRYLVDLLVWVFHAVQREFHLIVSFLLAVVDCEDNRRTFDPMHMLGFATPIEAVFLTTHLLEVSMQQVMERASLAVLALFDALDNVPLLIRLLKLYVGVCHDLAAFYGRRSALNRPLFHVAERVPTIIQRDLSRHVWSYIEHGDRSVAFESTLRLLQAILEEVTEEPEHTEYLLPIVEETMSEPLRYLLEWNERHFSDSTNVARLPPRSAPLFSQRQWNSTLVSMSLLNTVVGTLRPFRPFCQTLYQQMVLEAESSAMRLLEERYFDQAESSGLLDARGAAVDPEAMCRKWLEFIQRPDLFGPGPAAGVSPIRNPAMRHAMHTGAVVRFARSYPRANRYTRQPTQRRVITINDYDHRRIAPPERLVHEALLHDYRPPATA